MADRKDNADSSESAAEPIHAADSVLHNASSQQIQGNASNDSLPQEETVVNRLDNQSDSHPDTETTRVSAHNLETIPLQPLPEKTVVNPLFQRTNELSPSSGNRANLIALLSSDPNVSQRYDIITLIGSGGMGSIYKARDRRMKKVVAIKVIHAGLWSSEGELKEIISRFMTEGQAAGMLSDPAIVAVHLIDVTASGLPYMVMDYIEGTTLAQHLKTHGGLSPEQFRAIFIAVSSAIKHAHDRKVLHRDIKPSNIMLVGSGTEQTVRILDFGIAKILDESLFDTPRLTQTGEALGSPSYMSPEQINGRGVDERSDIYSLGCTMYESLAGCPPFIGATSFELMSMHMNAAPPAMADVSLGKYIPEELDRLVMRCLEKEPSQRFQSMEEVRRAIVASDKTRELEINLPSLTGKRQPDKAKAAPAKAEEPPVSRTHQIWILVGLLISFVAVMSFVGFSIVSKQDKPHAIKSGGSAGVRDLERPTNGFGLDGDTIGSVLEKSVREHPDTVHLDNEANVVDFTSGDIAVLSKLPNTVENVLLRFNGFNNEGLKAVAHLPMTLLNIDDSSVSDLSPIRGKTTLVTLSAVATPIDSSAIDVIKTLRKLQFLDLRNTSLKGSDIVKLGTIGTLRRVVVPNNGQVSFKDVIALQRSLPEAIIVYRNTKFEDFEKAFPLMQEVRKALNDKRHADVISGCERALSELRNYKGDDAPILKALSYKLIGEAQYDLNRFDDSVNSLHEAVRLISTEYFDDATLLPHIRNEEAAALERFDDREKARRALEIRQKILKTLDIIDPQQDLKEENIVALTADNQIGLELDYERLGEYNAILVHYHRAGYTLDRLPDSPATVMMKGKAGLVYANSLIDQLEATDKVNVSNITTREEARRNAVGAAHSVYIMLGHDMFYGMAKQLGTSNKTLMDQRKMIYKECETFKPKTPQSDEMHDGEQLNR